MKTLTFSNWIKVVLFLFALLITAILLSLSLGSVRIGVKEIVDILLFRMKEGTDAVIILKIRLPRILNAAVVGGALATAGAVFQALLRNPLADPYILGMSGGAALGAIAAIVLGLDMALGGFPLLPLFAFLGGAISIYLIYSVASSRGKISIHSLLLIGVIFNAFFTALILFIMSVVDYQKIGDIVFWLMGSLSSPSPVLLGIVSLAVLIGCLLLFFKAKDFNLICLGEEPASQLGVNLEETKKATFFAASLITGAAVSVSGLIGFVGLIIPHALRFIIGSDYRLLIPSSFLFGAVFLILADTIARVIIAPTEIPVGVITALCGGPFFLWLLKRNEKRPFF
jgi:iron complex transport system permease protein